MKLQSNFFSIEIEAKTDIGKTKNKNEDFYNIYLNNENVPLILVADGVTSNGGGDIASSTVVNRVGDNWENTSIDNSKNAYDWLESSIKKENENLLKVGENFPDLRFMATTLVSMIIFPKKNEFLLAHIGDSRSYSFRNDNLKQLTLDHSYVEQMKNEDDFDENVSSSLITKFIGYNKEVELDFLKSGFINNDIFLLGTDGLFKFVSDEEIKNILRNKDFSLKEKVDNLVSLANERGGEDNITIVLIGINKIN